MKPTGLILDPITPSDYIFGGNKLGDAPLQPDGQWYHNGYDFRRK